MSKVIIMFNTLFRLIAIILFLTLIPPAIFLSLIYSGPTYASDSNKIIATVNEDVITLAEVELAVEFLPEQLQRLPYSELVPLIREELIDVKLLASHALNSGLVKSDEIIRRRDFYEMRLIYDYFVRDVINKKLTDEILRERYNLFIKNFIGEEEIKTSHILVSNKETAEVILVKLAEGLDFSQAAKTYSTGPSASQGGDIGFIKIDQVVPEFGTVAFSLGIGEVSEPVKSQFGWHIIKIFEKRTQAAPSYINIEETLKAQVADDLIRQEANKIRSASKIEYFDEAFIEP